MHANKINRPDPSEKKKALIKRIKNISQENPSHCRQCGKCSASCPAATEMDLLPNQVVRYLQLGKPDKVINSETIWTCASCFTCAARCPGNIDIANIMEAARVINLRQRNKSEIDDKKMKETFDKDLPPQALVAGYRKYSK